MAAKTRGYWALAALALVGPGCTKQRVEQVTPACTGATARLRGVVADMNTSEPLPNALLAFEKDGLSEPNPDPTQANPAYVWGTQADVQGRFDLELPCGTVGLHAFSVTHHCAVAASSVGDALRLVAPPLEANAAAPALSNASLQPSTAAPGSPVTVQVTATAAAGDPLSDQVLAIAPELGLSLALGPPGVLPSGFADGLWKRTFQAPATPGTYTFQLAAASEGCVSSAPVPLTLTVR